MPITTENLSQLSLAELVRLQRKLTRELSARLTGQPRRKPADQHSTPATMHPEHLDAWDERGMYAF